MKPTWVVIMDTEKARIFEQAGRQGELQEKDCLVNPEAHLREQDLSSDRGGRGVGGALRGSHDLGDEQHFKKIKAHQFAKRIAEHLRKAAHEQDYDELVLCAEPRFLGIIRSELPGEVEQRVRREVHKDLGHLTRPEELRPHLLD
ncbi:host attachment protein [Marinobacteraceae bacterium S3BR75-40.1]